MGVRAGLTEIPPSLFKELVAGGKPKLPTEPRYSIDKAWYDFHMVFRAKGPPLSLAIAGDCLHSESPHTLDEFCKGNHEWYFGLMSPRLVLEIALMLRNVTSADYHRSEIEMFGLDYNCGELFFPHLRMAYLEAASRGNALMIVVC